MTYRLDAEDLAQLFPAFMEVDANLCLVRAGPAIRRHFPELALGRPIGEFFEWVGARGEPDFADLRGADGKLLRLRARCGLMDLTGSAINQPHSILLAVNIVPGSLAMAQHRLEVADFGPGDLQTENMLLVKLQEAMLEESRSIATELAQSRQRIQDLLDRVSRVAGYLAHDFNNYLSIIRLNGERLLKDPYLGDDGQRLARIIISTAERGSGITRSLMTLSNQNDDPSQAIRADALIADHMPYFSAVAGSPIAVTCDLNAPEAIVTAPRAGLTNCLINLVLNARDAMPHGGEITISTGVRWVAPIGGDGPAQPSLAIRVADTGTGMDPEILSRAFEPFFSTKANGSGIGLASVHDFVRQMGGEACLDSPPGCGTQVYLYFPISRLDATMPESPAPERPARPAGAGLHLLVVEDEPYALEALTDMLEGNGYRVTAADGAPEALAALEAAVRAGQAPDILLTDIVMPGGSGASLARRAQEIVPGIGVMLMSGYKPASEEVDPSWRYIGKPLDTGELCRMLQALAQERTGKNA